jgi:hypothetical protein
MCSVYHESRDLSSVFNGFRDFQQALGISVVKKGIADSCMNPGIDSGSHLGVETTIGD